MSTFDCQGIWLLFIEDYKKVYWKTADNNILKDEDEAIFSTHIYLLGDHKDSMNNISLPFFIYE